MWARLLSAALGAWLMAAPDVLGYSGAAGLNDHVVGPIVVGSAVVAAWPVMRPLRWVGLVAGTWLLVAPWIFGYYGTVAMENTSMVGFLLAALAHREMEKPSRKKGRRGLKVDGERLDCRGPCGPIRASRRPYPKEEVHA